jgi:biotin carboxyl carrier protein
MNIHDKPSSEDPPQPRKNLDIELEGRTRHIQLSLDSQSGKYFVTIDGEALQISACFMQPGVLSLIHEGRVYRCQLDEGPLGTAVLVNGERFSQVVNDPRSLAARRVNLRAADGEQTIKAPMPGRIVRILVPIGGQVSAQQPVVAIEAMKMQNELRALRAGAVKEIRVEAGQTVAAGEILMLLS